MDPETGFVMDLRILKELILSVVDKLDHRNINLDVDFMKGKMASTESIAMGIFEELAPKIQQHDAQLHAIKLYETENNFVEYFGE